MARLGHLRILCHQKTTTVRNSKSLHDSWIKARAADNRVRQSGMAKINGCARCSSRLGWKHRSGELSQCSEGDCTQMAEG